MGFICRDIELVAQKRHKFLKNERWRKTLEPSFSNWSKMLLLYASLLTIITWFSHKSRFSPYFKIVMFFSIKRNFLPFLVIETTYLLVWKVLVITKLVKYWLILLCFSHSFVKKTSEQLHNSCIVTYFTKFLRNLFKNQSFHSCKHIWEICCE